MEEVGRKQDVAAQKKASKLWTTLLSLEFVLLVIYKLHIALQSYTYYSTYIFIFLKQPSFLRKRTQFLLTLNINPN